MDPRQNSEGRELITDRSVLFAIEASRSLNKSDHTRSDY